MCERANECVSESVTVCESCYLLLIFAHCFALISKFLSIWQKQTFVLFVYSTHTHTQTQFVPQQHHKLFNYFCWWTVLFCSVPFSYSPSFIFPFPPPFSFPFVAVSVCHSPVPPPPSSLLSVCPLKRIELIAVCFGFLQALHNCGPLSYRNVC